MNSQTTETPTQVIFISGSTRGLGRVLARDLACERSVTVFHGRALPDAERSVDQFRSEFPSYKALGFAADYSKLSEVCCLAQSLSHLQLTMIVNNAASINPRNPAWTNDGFPYSYQVNFLAHWLLMELLLPQLVESGATVINIVSKTMSRMNLSEVRTIIPEKEAYARAKFGLLIMLRWISLQYPNLKTLAIHPSSLLNTGMTRDAERSPRSSVQKVSRQIADYLRAADDVPNCSYIEFGHRLVSPVPVDNDEALVVEVALSTRSLLEPWLAEGLGKGYSHSNL